MHKFLLPLVAIPTIATGITLFYENPVYAWTQFCNKTSSTVYVAYARNEELIAQGDVGISVADAPTTYKVSGWWQLTPGECETPDVATGSATTYNQNDETYSVLHYYYARAADANNVWSEPEWAGDNLLCVTNPGFERTQSIGGFITPEAAAAQRQCPADYYAVGFRRINSNTTNWTINLTYSQPNNNPPPPQVEEPPERPTICDRFPQKCPNNDF